MAARNSNNLNTSRNTDNAPGKEKGYIGRDSETTGKRSNLAAASAQATAKKRDTAGGKGEKRKPTEEELTDFAQELDRSMIEQAQTNFRKGLIASVIVVVIVVALIIAAKLILGINVEA